MARRFWRGIEYLVQWLQKVKETSGCCSASFALSKANILTGQQFQRQCSPGRTFLELLFAVGAEHRSRLSETAL